MPKQRFRSASEIATDPEAAKLLLARAEALLAIEEQAALLKASKADLFDLSKPISPFVRTLYSKQYFGAAEVSDELFQAWRVELIKGKSFEAARDLALQAVA